MRLEHTGRYFTVGLTIALAVGVSMFCGRLAGSGQIKTALALLIAIPVAVAAVHYNSKLWIAIPLLSGLSGFVVGLPLGLPLKDVVTVGVFLIFLVLKAVKIVRRKPARDLLDLVLFINLLYLAVVFIRNPVGALGFQTERIGGRPYFQIGVAWMGYWVLSRVRISPELAYKLPAIMTIGPLFDGFCGFIGQMVPSIGYKLGSVYSSFMSQQMRDELAVGATAATAEDSVESVRKTYLSAPGQTIATALTSYYPVWTLFSPLYFGRFLLMLLAMTFTLLSGFRSALAQIFLLFVIVSYLRGRLRQLLLGFGLVAPIIAMLVFGQGRIFDLPRNLQRALCFMPGKWDEDVVAAAEGSIIWRKEMWKDAFETNLYIQDKVWGDGFGVELRALLDVNTAISRGIGTRIAAEGQAIMGGFHHGPLSTIRVVGYVGLVFYFVLLALSMRAAWKLARQTHGSPYYPISIWLCLSTTIPTLLFLVGGGVYDIDLQRTIFSVGMLKLISQSLEEHKQKEAERALHQRPLRRA